MHWPALGLASASLGLIFSPEEFFESEEESALPSALAGLVVVRLGLPWSIVSCWLLACPRLVWNLLWVCLCLPSACLLLAVSCLRPGLGLPRLALGLPCRRRDLGSLALAGLVLAGACLGLALGLPQAWLGSACTWLVMACLRLDLS